LCGDPLPDLIEPVCVTAQVNISRNYQDGKPEPFLEEKPNTD
jgi:hypothetical protein